LIKLSSINSIIGITDRVKWRKSGLVSLYSMRWPLSLVAALLPALTCRSERLLRRGVKLLGQVLVACTAGKDGPENDWFTVGF
jgi:hypothetical protein